MFAWCGDHSINKFCLSNDKYFYLCRALDLCTQIPSPVQVMLTVRSILFYVCTYVDPLAHRSKALQKYKYMVLSTKQNFTHSTYMLTVFKLTSALVAVPQDPDETFPLP
jgi:hypothetical protein